MNFVSECNFWVYRSISGKVQTEFSIRFQSVENNAAEVDNTVIFATSLGKATTNTSKIWIGKYRFSFRSWSVWNTIRPWLQIEWALGMFPKVDCRITKSTFKGHCIIAPHRPWEHLGCEDFHLTRTGICSGGWQWENTKKKSADRVCSFRSADWEVCSWRITALKLRKFNLTHG